MTSIGVVVVVLLGETFLSLFSRKAQKVVDDAVSGETARDFDFGRRVCMYLKAGIFLGVSIL